MCKRCSRCCGISAIIPSIVPASGHLILFCIFFSFQIVFQPYRCARVTGTTPEFSGKGFFQCHPTTLEIQCFTQRLVQCMVCLTADDTASENRTFPILKCYSSFLCKIGKVNVPYFIFCTLINACIYRLFYSGLLSFFIPEGHLFVLHFFHFIRAVFLRKYRNLAAFRQIPCLICIKSDHVDTPCFSYKKSS